MTSKENILMSKNVSGDGRGDSFIRVVCKSGLYLTVRDRTLKKWELKQDRNFSHVQEVRELIQT